MSKGVEFLLDSSRGVYLPRDFVELEEMNRWNLLNDPRVFWARDECRKGPDATELYWEAWDEILDSAYRIDEKGNRWTLHQDSDLFAVCVELMDDDEYEHFFGEKREPEPEQAVSPFITPRAVVEGVISLEDVKRLLLAAVEAACEAELPANADETETLGRRSRSFFVTMTSMLQPYLGWETIDDIYKRTGFLHLTREVINSLTDAQKKEDT